MNWIYTELYEFCKKSAIIPITKINMQQQYGTIWKYWKRTPGTEITGYIDPAKEESAGFKDEVNEIVDFECHLDQENKLDNGHTFKIDPIIEYLKKDKR